MKDISRITSTRQPARFRPPLPRDRCGPCPVRFAGERAGVRGPYCSLKPPHPGPLPHSGVHPESSADCGGEGAEPWKTPCGNPSRRCPQGRQKPSPTPTRTANACPCGVSLCRPGRDKIRGSLRHESLGSTTVPVSPLTSRRRQLQSSHPPTHTQSARKHSLPTHHSPPPCLTTENCSSKPSVAR